jgi:hypothetical protein
MVAADAGRQGKESGVSTTANLVQDMRARGIKIWTEGGNIRVHGNVQTLPAEIVDTLRSRKSEIVHHLEQTQTVEDIPRVPRTETDALALTATQAMPWHYTSRRRSRARSIAFAQRIHGPLDVAVLGEALCSLQHRHDALRIRFSGYPAETRQFAQRTATAALEHIDLSQATDAQAKAAACLAQFVERKIDYGEDPLFGTLLLRLSREEHILVCSIAHIISDGVSNQILLRELWNSYEALLIGRVPALPLLQVQFLDHVHWLERTYPNWLRASAPYWLARLASARPLSWPLPTDAEGPHTRDDIAPMVGCMLSFDARLQRGIYDLAQTYRTLPAFVVLTAYVASVLLWCDREDLTIAVVDLGRYRPELANIVGCLTHHLHLRVERSRGQSFLDLLGVVRSEFSAASAHRDFDRIANILPEFRADVYFNWTPAVEEKTSTCGEMFRLEPLPMKPDRSTSLELAKLLPFKSMLACGEAAGQLCATLHSSSQCFSTQSAARFCEHFVKLMKTVCEQPQRILA